MKLEATGEAALERAAPKAVGIVRRLLVHLTLERAVWVVLGIIVIGIAIVPLLYVFNAAFSPESNVGLSDGFSLQAVLDVYTSGEYLGYLLNTLVLAALVTVISVIVGVAMAVIVSRTDIRFKSAFDLLIIMPLFMSPFAGLMAWIALGSAKSGFINVLVKTIVGPFLGRIGPLVDIWSYAGIVWVMVIFFCPFAYLFTVGNLRGMDSSLEESARTTGAGPFQTISRITLPMSSPAILGSALLIFVLCAEMYTIPGMIGANFNFTTLPWKIYNDINGVPVQLAHAAASGTLLLWVTCFGIWLQRRLTQQTERFTTMTGKGFRGTPIRLGGWAFAAWGLVLFYIGVADVLPFGGLIVSALMKYSASSLNWSVFTTKNFTDFFLLPDMAGALWNTLLLAVLSAVCCCVIGLVISYMEVRRPSIPTKVLAFLGVLPVAVPGVVYGIGLMWTFLRTPLYGSIWVLLFAYIAKFLPFSIVVTRSAIVQVHPDLEQSARMSGADGFQALRSITIPLLKPTLIAVIFFVMLNSVKELSASVLLYTQRSEVLSVLTWHYMDAGEYQFAAAIGVVQTVIMIALIFATRRIFGVRLESAMARSGA